MICVLGGASQAAADSITLQWDASTTGLVGYKVHVGAQSGTYTQHFDVGSTTGFTFATATPGQRYCFAVSAYLILSALEGPNSQEVCGYSNQPPTLVNPGNRTSTVGQATTLQLQGSDPEGQAVSYTATGLPTGLSLGASTGFISGTPTTAGTFSVSARSNDGALNSAAQAFTWTVSAAAGDTTRPTATIAAPTTAATYSTTSSTIGLSGTASDNTGVTQVTWSNDRGGSGSASGTTSWSVASIALQSGANNITITARDAAGNQASDLLTVTASFTSSALQFVGITTSKPSPLALNAPATFTAAASGGTAPYQYKWTLFDGTSWNMVQQWTSNASYSWTPTVAKTTYQIAVWIRSAGNTQDAPEVYGIIPFTVSAQTVDTTVPSVAITGPTSAATYSVTSNSITLTGTSSDNVGVTQVSWVNARGGSGTATGTTSWNSGAIALQTGSNAITVTARDAAGNVATDVLTVTTTAVAPLTLISVTTDKPSPQNVRSTITFTANVSGGTGPYQYKWTLYDGDWKMIQQWNSSKTFTWTPNKANANYKMAVWVRNAGNTADAPQASGVIDFPIR